MINLNRQHIKIEILSINTATDTYGLSGLSGDVRFKIVYSKRSEEFGVNGSWLSRNGVKFLSANMPQLTRALDNTLLLYVWGDDTSADNTILYTVKREFEKILIAIDEFNIIFNGGCNNTCGSVMCKECIKDLYNLMRFSYVKT